MAQIAQQDNLIIEIYRSFICDGRNYKTKAY